VVSNFEQQARDMNAAARLGAPAGEPARFGPLPLGHYAGSILLVLAGIALLFGLADPLLRIPVLVGAVVCIAPGAYLLYRRTRNRGTLTPHERGVAVALASRRFAFTFDELERVTVVQKEQLNNGVRTGLRRSVALQGASDRVRFESFTRDNTPDTVGEAAEARVMSGGSLRGAGWAVDSAGLRAKRGAPVPLAEITAAGIHQDRLSLWRGEEAEAFFTVAAASANARVLHALVARRLERQPERPTRGMGRLLFQKSSSRLTAGVAALFGIVVAGTGLATGDAAVMALCSFLGLLCVVGGAALLRQRFQAFEMGLVRRTLFGERTVLYADVERLTYVATRHYYNGVYTGTQLVIKCGTAHGTVSFSSTVRGQESDLEGLREHMARIVARKLYTRLQQETEVPWVNGVKISRTGLRFRRHKMIGRGEEVFRPWSELRFSIQEGFLHLFEPDQKKSTAWFECGTENFYPGLVLFETLPAEEASAGRAG
jgi:hypothetical protein